MLSGVRGEHHGVRLRAQGRGFLETTTRPKLNRRSESARLYKHTPLKVSHASTSDLGSSACSQRPSCKALGHYWEKVKKKSTVHAMTAEGRWVSRLVMEGKVKHLA